MSTAEPNLLKTARKILADAETELAFLYQAQAEDIVSVTLTSRSGEIRTLPVSRKSGFSLCGRLIEAGEKRVQRLSTELLRLVQVEGSDAGIALRQQAQ